MIKIIKFGGTIINNEVYNDNIMEIINNTLKNNDKLIIVVSAMGRDNDPYSTSKLNSLGNYLDDIHKAEILSYGERLSSLVFLNNLLEKGYNANVLPIEKLGINLQGDYLKGELLSLDNTKIKEEITNHDILIVPGFIGINNNKIGLLGMGGSDLTAVYIAKMLNANEIILYKDVNGVMSGDPKIIADCKTISNLSYDECLIFTKCGAKIVQDLAIKEAKDNKIRVKIYNINDLKEKTIISEKSSNLLFKGIMSKDEYIYLIFDDYEKLCINICLILEKYNFECMEVKKDVNYLRLKLVGGKRNFAMNILHHYLIGNNTAI